jgi:hypothetical protein
VEDFDNTAEATAESVLGGIIEYNKLLGSKQRLKRDLKSEGIFIELSFQDGLEFIENKLGTVDYVILDIDLPAYTGNTPNEKTLAFYQRWHGYKKQDDKTKDEEILRLAGSELRKVAGYHLYVELVLKLGFPKQHILFCSNNGKNLTSIEDAFEKAKIERPDIREKSDEFVRCWVKSRYESPYSRLRRGIIEGCQYAKKLDQKSFYFNEYIDKKENIDPDDISNYLDVLENFLPLREPEKPEKRAIFYKLFVRTLSHEWEAADAIGRKGHVKKEASLAWIMRNTRHWITHNSELFSSLDEKMVAYLFMINLRVMFSFDGTVQPYEKILLNLFYKDTLPEKALTEKLNDRSMLSIAYYDLKSLVVTENERGLYIKDALYFNQLANNIQECNLCALRSDKKLFNKLLYQHFWLTTSNSYIDKNTSELKFWRFNYTETPYIKELARHIYRHSFPEV